MENHIATPQDFKSAQDLDRRVERVVLPKLRKAVLLRRPSPLWFAFRGQLPQSLAVTAAAPDRVQPPVIQNPEGAQALTNWILDLLTEVMVEPRISLSPGPGEIPPELISDEDLTFILRWAVGEVATEGLDDPSVRDLATFRGN
ncbi:MAG: hypothetical protein ACRD06_02615 [Terriglobia bacterium]